MASNGSAQTMAPDAILAAMATMRGGDAGKKKVAMDYLSNFQKSVCSSLSSVINLIFAP